jgi:hypothetical protein
MFGMKKFVSDFLDGFRGGFWRRVLEALRKLEYIFLGVNSFPHPK